MKIRPRHLVCIMTLAGLLAVFSACGRKTDPLTPDSPRPEAVRITKVTVRDNVAYLSWPLPARNVEGKPMTADQISLFQVFRAEIGPDRKRSRFREVAVIEMARPVNAEVAGGIVIWKDQDLKYGQIYVYRVRVESVRGWFSSYSDEVRVVPLLTVSPPKSVTAVGGDRDVSLTWEPVTSKMDGSRHEGFVGYHVYRGTAPGHYEDKPLTAEPIRTASYKDTAVVNGKTYYYMVRAVDSPVLPWRESPDSAEASATPRDRTSPARPTGLTVVPGVKRVFLTWNENKESDIAGYHVYRSLKSGKEYTRLTETMIKHTTYSDVSVRSGAVYFYVITAVDETGNESPPSKEMKAATEQVR
jgi:hypothetical protein